VTIFAPWRQGIALGYGLAVQRGFVEFLLSRMADAAIDGLNFFCVWQLGPGKIQMAGRA
jgi:hypothetical protein